MKINKIMPARGWSAFGGKKLTTIFIALLIVLPIFGLVGVHSVKAKVKGDTCGFCVDINNKTNSTRCLLGIGDCTDPYNKGCLLPGVAKDAAGNPTSDDCVNSVCRNTGAGKVCVATLDPWGAGSGGAITAGSLQANTGLGAKDPREVAANVVNIVLGFLGIIAVILILVGGFMWMSAVGNEEKVTTAKKVMAAGAIGLVIVLAAFGIAKFVINAMLGATTT